MTISTRQASPGPPAAGGVDFDTLMDWMDDRRLGTGPITAVEIVAGGTQNVMLRFTRAARHFILRRGPLHLRTNSNDAIRREMRVLGALTDTGVPHPRLVAACPDESVLDGAAFYLMDPVDGFNATVELPSRHAADRTIRDRMGYAFVDALATIGAVDHHAVGLSDLGKPEGFLQRQVPRWLAELDGYSRYDGYPRETAPAVEHIAEWLVSNRPSGSIPGIMHGDYHLANVMFSPTGPDVVAVVDWEMCTIGDPLLDLGWVLATWPEPDTGDHVTGGALASAGGLPTGRQLQDRYAERSDRDLSAMPWYHALACFKLGILLEGTYARSCAGLAPAAVGMQLHAMNLKLIDRASAIIRTN